MARGRVARWLFAAAGGVCLALGVVGIVLPLLPSTPFFLLAVAAFARSSPRAYDWMLSNRYFGAQLRDYRERRGATRRSKAVAIATIWAGITLTVVLATPPMLIAILLYAIATAVSYYLVRLETISASSRQVHAGERGMR